MNSPAVPDQLSIGELRDQLNSIVRNDQIFEAHDSKPVFLRASGRVYQLTRMCPSMQAGVLGLMLDGTLCEHQPGVHEYTSTACLHDQCGSCRNTCKYCDVSCAHACHQKQGKPVKPVPWVEQARDLAIELHQIILNADLGGGVFSPALKQRLSEDPGLFWLRGEAAPPGVWRPPDSTEHTSENAR